MINLSSWSLWLLLLLLLTISLYFFIDCRSFVGCSHCDVISGGSNSSYCYSTHRGRQNDPCQNLNGTSKTSNGIFCNATWILARSCQQFTSCSDCLAKWPNEEEQVKFKLFYCYLGLNWFAFSFLSEMLMIVECGKQIFKINTCYLTANSVLLNHIFRNFLHLSRSLCITVVNTDFFFFLIFWKITL